MTGSNVACLWRTRLVQRPVPPNKRLTPNKGAENLNVAGPNEMCCK